MATVIGIFEDQYKNNLPLTVVKPGTQTRKFTHIKDTIKTCIMAWKKNQNKHYSISSKKNYSILQIAKLFDTKIKYLPERRGERYASKLTKMNLSNSVINKIGIRDIKHYISNFRKKNKY
jgi:UDP-glucose 4-epimerase